MSDGAIGIILLIAITAIVSALVHRRITTILERLSGSNGNQCLRVPAVGVRSCWAPRSVCSDCNSGVWAAQLLGFDTCWQGDRKHAPKEEATDLCSFRAVRGGQ